jgi:crotonobetaine/carnitine-CoA ligase
MQPDEVLPRLLARRAAETPDRIYLIEPGGASATYRELHGLGRRWATALHRLGVGRGGLVAALLPPSVTAIAAWLGLAWLGATPVAINPALRGEPLRRAVRRSGAQVCLIADQYLPAIEEVPAELPGGLRVVSVTTGAASPVRYPPGAGRIEDYLAAGGAVPERDGPSRREPQPGDTATVLFTSGTTGLPKPVVVTWAQLHAAASGHIPLHHLSAGDVWYSPFPLFHVSGLFPVYAMALTGGQVVLRERFRTQDFWPDVHAFGCTTALMFGATVTFLLDAPPSEDDPHNSLTKVIGYFPRSAQFLSRFAIPHHYRAYNQTETSVPIATAGAEDVPDEQTCGRVREGYEARLLDQHGRDVPGPGSGELLVRAADPLALSPGYLNDPEATSALWKDGWLHSGDILRRDNAGWFYFVDRVSDFIRRRGENISPAEIEIETARHPAVREAAAVGLPADDGDEDIKLIVVPARGQELSEAELAHWLEGQLPGFMIPRYIEFTDTLPRTATGKVQKAGLRQGRAGGRTWDRTAAAYLDHCQAGHGRSRAGGRPDTDNGPRIS